MARLRTWWDSPHAAAVEAHEQAKAELADAKAIGPETLRMDLLAERVIEAMRRRP